jgi:hypothetical protein
MPSFFGSLTVKYNKTPNTKPGIPQIIKTQRQFFGIILEN